MVKKKAESKTEAPTKKLTTAELEKEVVRMANDNVPSAKIGLALKKEYGIPKAKYSLGKINKILAKNKIKRFPEELQNLLDRATKLKQHTAKNQKDQVSKRGLQITEAKIRNLAAYFKRSKILDSTWEYKSKNN